MPSWLAVHPGELKMPCKSATADREFQRSGESPESAAVSEALPARPAVRVPRKSSIDIEPCRHARHDAVDERAHVGGQQARVRIDDVNRHRCAPVSRCPLPPDRRRSSKMAPFGAWAAAAAESAACAGPDGPAPSFSPFRESSHWATASPTSPSRPQCKRFRYEHGSRTQYARFSRTAFADDTLGPDEAEFIRARRQPLLSRRDATGWPYIQHRGGTPGDSCVLDEPYDASPARTSAATGNTSHAGNADGNDRVRYSDGLRESAAAQADGSSAAFVDVAAADPVLLAGSTVPGY